jgi:hypothetical protein
MRLIHRSDLMLTMWPMLRSFRLRGQAARWVGNDVLKALLRLARKRTGDVAEAEDLVAEALMRVMHPEDLPSCGVDSVAMTRSGRDRY